MGKEVEELKQFVFETISKELADKFYAYVIKNKIISEIEINVNETFYFAGFLTEENKSKIKEALFSRDYTFHWKGIAYKPTVIYMKDPLLLNL